MDLTFSKEQALILRKGYGADCDCTNCKIISKAIREALPAANAQQFVRRRGT